MSALFLERKEEARSLQKEEEEEHEATKKEGEELSWFHYAAQERQDNMMFEIPDEPVTKIKALYFAQGDDWLASGIPQSIRKRYTHKYALSNLDALKICEISMKTLHQYENPFIDEPLRDGGIVFNWKALENAGFDGVCVRHWDVYDGFEDKFQSWPFWVHLFDVDTLVLWRGAKLTRVHNDFDETK